MTAPSFLMTVLGNVKTGLLIARDGILLFHTMRKKGPAHACAGGQGLCESCVSRGLLHENLLAIAVDVKLT